MGITQYHAKYLAYDLTRQAPSDSIEKLTSSLFNARVDLNPHQVEAALFAFNSPLSKGAILADEVGLGKTIEAGLVISQHWAERKRHILIIVPANLRKQWNQELLEKFFISSMILESLTFKAEINRGNLNPFDQSERIIICSYNFARQKEAYIKQTPWDLICVDEAHKLRNVYKTTSKVAKIIKEAINPFKKILLTATPLQNSLLELYGLVSVVDENLFGDLKSFRNQYARLGTFDTYEELKKRLTPVCKRTLRRQVLEYIRYTSRHAITQEFFPSDSEQALYDMVSDYLQRERLWALPSSQRQLMTLILRKLLASSTYAISSTLEKLSQKLIIRLEESRKLMEEEDLIGVIEDNLEEAREFWDEADENSDDAVDEVISLNEEEVEELSQEAAELKHFSELAHSINRNAKGEVLLTALEKGFKALSQEKGALYKAVIFTESTKTQAYLYELLSQSSYAGKIVMFNGSNNDPLANRIYAEWLAKHKYTDKVTGSPTADKRQALIDYFRDEAEIMIATEAGAEGINLQFCSIVVNYDLPWNPQRIEQRIGRCHRYGQKHDVVVINFINKRNAADQRVYELLSEKFKLFDGVFGSSDEILGIIESGIDFEKRIVEIYQKCRTESEIQASFDQLQQELDTEISSNIQDTRQKLLENFDEEVHEKLKVNLSKSENELSRLEENLWKFLQFALNGSALFQDENKTFKLVKNPVPALDVPLGTYSILKTVEADHFCRLNLPFIEHYTNSWKQQSLTPGVVEFNYTDYKSTVHIIEPLVGKKGILKAVFVRVDSLEREEYIKIAGILEDGSGITEEALKRLFFLNARTLDIPLSLSSLYPKMEESIQKSIKAILDGVNARNAGFFEAELEKLDLWGEDQRASLKATLKEYDDAIKDLKKQSRLAPTLPAKLDLEKKRREYEKKREEAWKAYDQSAKAIEERKDLLIDDIEKRLNQIVHTEELFTLEWYVI